jgi:hypothetical protein
MSRLYQDDIGAHIVVETSNTAIPASAVLQLHVTKPTGVFATWALTAPMINLTTGVITYHTIAGDLSEVGEYKVQVHGVFLDGTNETSDIDSFTVYQKLA